MSNGTEQVYCNVTVNELRRAYNAGKATGRSNFVPGMAPTYRGTSINFLFKHYGVVDYLNAITGEVVAVFQDNAYLDD